MHVRELIDILSEQPPDAEVELAVIAPVDEDSDDITVDRYPVDGVLPVERRRRRGPGDLADRRRGRRRRRLPRRRRAGHTRSRAPPPRLTPLPGAPWLGRAAALASWRCLGTGPLAPAKSSGYLPGLDGLRAISVVAVLLYHADMPWLDGGFLGVEVFFVISGYLITLLLTQEHERTSTDLAAELLDAPRPPVARRPVHAAGDGLDGRADLLPRGRDQAGRPGLGGADVRHQLVPDLHRSVVLRPDGAAAGVPAPLVAGDRGAVLPRVAAAAARPAAPVQGSPPRRSPGSSRSAPSPRSSGWRSCSSRRWIPAGRTTAPTPGRRGCCSAPPWRSSGSRATSSVGDDEVKTGRPRPPRPGRPRRPDRVLRPVRRRPTRSSTAAGSPSLSVASCVAIAATVHPGTTHRSHCSACRSWSGSACGRTRCTCGTGRSSCTRSRRSTSR